MTNEEKLEQQIEAMGFDIEIESEPNWTQVWISNKDQAYLINFWDDGAAVRICGTNITRRFGWYESALRFIIKHHKNL